MGNLSCVPGAEVDERAPWQSERLIADYSSYSGPVTDRFTGSFVPGQAEEGAAAMEANTTLVSLFKQAARTKGDKVIMRTERPCPEIVDGKAGAPLPVDQWKAWTIAEYLSEVQVAARAFMALGLKSRDAVAIYGFNSPEWLMGEMAAVYAGGVAAGIYPTDTPAQVAYKAEHSAAVVAVVETAKQAAAFVHAAARLKKLKAIVIWDPDLTTPAEFESMRAVAGSSGFKVLHWSELPALAAASAVSVADVEAAAAAAKPNECCAYIYTSGTTGAPKAVMVSHDNIVFETRAVLRAIEVIGTQPEEERIVSYLPLSHVAGMMVDIVLPLICAAELPGWVCCFFARAYDLRVGSIVERFKAVRPTIFLGVPRVWEKIQAKMVAVRQALVASGDMSATAVRVAAWGKALSLEHASARQLGGSGARPFMYGPVGEGLVQKKAKAALGLDACKFAFTGAAPIAVDTLRYFASVGVNINEVYGMSECTGAATWSTDRAHVWGSCGWAVPGVEVKVFQDGGGSGGNVEVPNAKDMFKPTEAEQGELCYRGRNVMMGYLANPDLGPDHVADIEKKTKETIDAQGWLHSGDKGCRDARGMFRITGRYKELLIGAGGENIAPVPVEDCIKSLCPAVSNVMMVGDKMPFNCALVTLKCVGANGELPGTSALDGEVLAYQDSVAQPGDAKADTVAEASVPGSALAKAIMAAIVATNKNEDACPMNAAKVQKFMILPLDFAVSTDDFTPTFKLKRAAVHARFEAEIQHMYASKDDYVPFSSALK